MKLNAARIHMCTVHTQQQKEEYTCVIYKTSISVREDLPSTSSNSQGCGKEALGPHFVYLFERKHIIYFVWLLII